MRQRESTRGEGQRGGETGSQAHAAPSVWSPTRGSNSRNLEIMTRATLRSRTLSRLSHQAPQLLHRFSRLGKNVLASFTPKARARANLKTPHLAGKTGISVPPVPLFLPLARPCFPTQAIWVWSLCPTLCPGLSRPARSRSSVSAHAGRLPPL